MLRLLPASVAARAASALRPLSSLAVLAAETAGGWVAMGAAESSWLQAQQEEAVVTQALDANHVLARKARRGVALSPLRHGFRWLAWASEEPESED